MATKNPNPKDSTDSRPNNLDEVRERVITEIAESLRGDRPILLEALPATGKSRGLINAVDRTGERVVIFTHRGHEEQYSQFEEWCGDFGLTCKRLPAVDEECPTFRGDHGEYPRKRVCNLRDAGASPGHIHGRLELPCQASGACPYEDSLAFAPTNYEVLVGHPKHAYVENYLEDRVPVYDEFPGGAYLIEIEDTPRVVSSYLHDHRLPFNDYTGLLENRDNEDWRQSAFERLKRHSLVDERPLFKHEGDGHKLAGLCVLTLLGGEELGNGWESCILGADRVGLFHREEDTVHILNPPDLPEHVLGLDGTPTKLMWNLALGLYDRRRRLDHRQVLDETERQQYVTQCQNLRVVPTTTDVRPYSGGNTSPNRDAALLHEVAEREPGLKGVISSRRGLDDVAEEFEKLDSWKNAYYGNLLGSNGLGDVDVGVVLGSSHYGNEFIKKWTALAGVAAETNGKFGLDKSYGDLGDEILEHMRENQVLQALFRFAREGKGARVYVDTVALPGWVPVVAPPWESTIDTWSPAEQDVMESLKQLGDARTSEIAKAADRSPRTVRKVLGDISSNIVAERRAEDGRGGAKVWSNQGMRSSNPYGQVCLAAGGDAARFSEQMHLGSNNGIVPKKPPHKLQVQREREQREELERRRHRLIKQIEMERWYVSS